MAESTGPPRSVEDVKALLETTEKGGFRNSIRNCLTVFQCDPLLSGAVAYNLLTDRTDILKPIGYKRTPDSPMTDTDMKYIRLYLEETYGLTSEKKIQDAADLAAHQNRNRRQDNMNSNEKNTALYEKMAAEQDTFRDWLKSQSPEEVLNHAYEYTVREDIVMAMEELELSDAQAQALLDSPSPLADVYRHFEKLETGYMDVIRDSIEERANEMHKAKEEQRAAPVYPHSAAYASEHGEMAQYRASLQVSLACKEAIEQAISAHYGDNRLNTEAAVKEVLEQFGPERVQYILANTVLKKEHDGRISRDNKAWAKTIPMPEDGGDPRHSYVLVVDKVNPGLTDLFVKQARKVLQAPEKGSVLEKLKQEPPERRPAAPKKREPER